MPRPRGAVAVDDERLHLGPGHRLVVDEVEVDARRWRLRVGRATAHMHYATAARRQRLMDRLGDAVVLVDGEDPSWAPNSRTLMFCRGRDHAIGEPRQQAEGQAGDHRHERHPRRQGELAQGLLGGLAPRQRRPDAHQEEHGDHEQAAFDEIGSHRAQRARLRKRRLDKLRVAQNRAVMFSSRAIRGRAVIEVPITDEAGL